MPLNSLITRFARPRDWESFSVNVEPGVPDQRISLKPKTTNILNLAAGGVFALGIVVFMSFQEGDGVPIVDSPFFMSVIVLFGVGSIVWSLLIVLSKREVLFTNDGVEVTGRSLLGMEQWQEPYSGYKGVLHREKSVSQGQNSGSTLYQILELVHDDPARNLPLLVESSGTMPRAAWEAYAKWFGLPALSKQGRETVARAHDDLDKSISELAAEGKIETRLDYSDKSVPKGLYVANESNADGECLRVTISVPRVHLGVKVFVCGIPVVIGLATAIGFTYAVFAGASDSVIFIGAILAWLWTLLFIGLCIWWHMRDRRARRDILISRTKLVATDHTETSFDLSEIEAITMNTSQNQIGGGIVIAADRTQVEVGGGLSKTAKIWLKDFLTSAVATA